jgi:DnaJ-class molecular chaperone
MSAEKYLECPECKGSGEADRIEHDSVPCGACNGKGSAEKI